MLSTVTLSTLGIFGITGCASKEIKTQEGAASAASSQPTGKGIPLVGTSQVYRYSLDNGLRLLVVPDHSSPTFAYQTWFKVGSRDEIPTRTGLAHLFEHMMFKETKTLKDGEFDRMLEGAGAEGENAFTSRDYTAYVQELPKDKLELITRLEADRMVNLGVNDQAFKTERDVVQNERRFRNENSPDGLMYQELFDIAFTQHPYHWPVIGYQKDLDGMTAQDAVSFYNSYYSPNHATIIVVGDVDPILTLEQVKLNYGALLKKETPPHTVPNEPEQSGIRRKSLKLNIQVEKLLMGYHVPEAMNADIPALNVLQTVLTGGKSSRLYRALVDMGISTSVESDDLEDKDPSLFLVSSNLQKQKKAVQAESIIKREIERLSNELIGDKELERAKNRLSFGFYEGLSSNNEKARLLGHYETIANDFEAGTQLYHKTQTVTAKDIQTVVQKYLTSKNLSVITGVPK